MERRLLAALAAVHPAGATVDALLDALWGATPPPSARKTLQTNVLRLRQVLGIDTIVTTPDGYRLGPDVRVDATEFEGAAELAWWRGEPFGDLTDWGPAEGRRARLVELHRRAEDSAAESLLAAGSATGAVADLERLVAEDPAREVRWTLLVRALVAADRRPEALRAYERARRTLAAELGLAPGPELDAAHRAALAADAAAPQADDPIVVIDRLLADGAIRWSAGEARAATSTFVKAAGLARQAGDVRRFAEATLGAAGDGVRVSLDATEEVTSLVREALTRVPPGPTPTRCRLLARLSVLQSQHTAPGDNELPARTALAIARTLDDPALLAGALAAMTTAVVDPLRNEERRGWLNEMLALADAWPNQPWRRWALPFDARERTAAGDLDGALATFAELETLADATNDVVGRHAASYGRLLCTTVVGDWAGARAAAAHTRQTASEALFDEGAAIMGEMGMLGVIDFLSDVEQPHTLTAAADIEWPTPEMAAAVIAYSAATHARHDRLDEAQPLLDHIQDLLPDLTRDGYWLATVAMTADACHCAGHREVAAMVRELLTPALDLTITDPGLLYRGAAAHFAGLAADTLGRRDDAVELLHAGLATHERHGATWMADRSHAALSATA
jgi:DNA-binding SARP family transcriptional activator